MTTTDELREAVAREVRRAIRNESLFSAENQTITNGAIEGFTDYAGRAADRIIRMVVDACIDEVPGGSICDPQDVVDFLRALAPEEPAP